MAQRTAGNPPVRLRGQNARRRLLESLRQQSLVAGDAELARRIARVGLLQHHATGTVLIRQGDQQNDLLLILSGEVSVQVHGREVARRVAGHHVGEMSLVNTLARRSASVVCCEESVTLTLNESQFTSLASRNPELWRRIAVQIAERLRDRNRFVRPPNARPIVFVGSSTEAQKVAEVVGKSIQGKYDLTALIWTNGVFQPSQTGIESLVSMASSADFACLVLSADDVTTSRGKRSQSPRDNVVFELGLLIGALGRERVFLLKPSKVNVRIPSDLLGVVWLEYMRTGPFPLRRRLLAACKTMLVRIQSLGPR